jgi:hypothetical protein
VVFIPHRLKYEVRADTDIFINSTLNARAPMTKRNSAELTNEEYWKQREAINEVSDATQLRVTSIAVTLLAPLALYVLMFVTYSAVARGSVVVKVLCYKPEGRGFDSR